MDSKETQNKTALSVIQKLGLACFQNCIRLKKPNAIPCLTSDIPSEELWLLMREELLTTGTFTEKQADACTTLFSRTELPSTVMSAMRDQMVVEVKELIKLGHGTQQFVFIKIVHPEEGKPACALLFELGMLHRDLKGFTSLSKAQRQPLVIYDP
jgi:hypothetical protein